MKKMAILLFLVVLCSASVSEAADSFGPKIASKEVRHHLGKVVQGVRASHVFTISNEGNETLVIDRVQSS